MHTPLRRGVERAQLEALFERRDGARLTDCIMPTSQSNVNHSGNASNKQ